MTLVLSPNGSGGVVVTSIMDGQNIEKAIEKAIPKGVPYQVVQRNAFDFRYQEAIRWNDGNPVMDTSLVKQAKLTNGELVKALSTQFESGLNALEGILSPEQEADFFLIEAAIEKAINRGRFQAVLALLNKPKDLPEQAEAFRIGMVEALEELINGS